jgi:hypothetical protein
MNAAAKPLRHPPPWFVHAAGRLGGDEVDGSMYRSRSGIMRSWRVSIGNFAGRARTRNPNAWQMSSRRLRD